MIPIINTECTIITDIGVHRFNSGVCNQIIQTLGRSVHDLTEGKVSNLKVVNKKYENNNSLMAVFLKHSCKPRPSMTHCLGMNYYANFLGGIGK